MENNSDTKVLAITVNAGFSTEAMELARAEGALGATIINTRSEGATHESFLGITVDTEREMLLILIDSPTADKIMAAVDAQMGVNSPAQGSCFTLPVEKSTKINRFPSGVV